MFFFRRTFRMKNNELEVRKLQKFWARKKEICFGGPTMTLSKIRQGVFSLSRPGP